MLSTKGDGMSESGEADLVHVKDDGRVRTIRFNRPDKLNAINAPTIDVLYRAYSAAAVDDEVHVVLMTGTGRAFTTGADLSDLKSENEGEVAAFPEWAMERFDQLQALLEAYPKPLVAAVNGLAVGLGFTMLGYCDFAFVAEGARLRTPFSQLGLSPEASSSYTFPLRMGWANAARALMLGDWFTAQDLVDGGLAQQVVPDDQLIEVTDAFAARLAQAPLQSLVATKRLMLQAHRAALAETRKLEAESLAALVGTPANVAAIEAFAARRK
jgi:enoyl-CoA hydratase/carnithine racemase